MEKKEERTNVNAYNPFVAYYPTKDEIKGKVEHFKEESSVQDKSTKQRMSDDELIKRIYGI